MPKKYTGEEVQGWTMAEVQSWLYSKGMQQCLPDFQSVTGVQLLSMTNDDLKSLPTVSGNDKKRKALKKALSQLPGNSVSSKSKSKSNKPTGKLAPPAITQALPPSSFEPVPPIPPGPPPTSTFHAPYSPNSATYSDPTLLFPADEEQELYDNPAAEDGVPPPLPPYPYDPQQGAPQTNYEEEDDQMIYDQYDEEEMYDSSFASEEEEDDEEYTNAPQNGCAVIPQSSEANIRAISAKFFAGGLTAHTGISTVATPPGQRRGFGQMEELEDEEDDGIYDLPPEAHAPPPPPDVPPEGPPPAVTEDIYDIVEEVLTKPGHSDTATTAKGAPPVPLNYMYPPTYPPETEEPPMPPRPPKPSPSMPRAAAPSPPPSLLPVRPALPAMRMPIRSAAAAPPPLVTRPPGQSTTPTWHQTETTPPHTDPIPSQPAVAPPPPPPPPLSSSPSPPPWSKKQDTAKPANKSSQMFGGGRRPSDSHSQQTTQTNNTPAPPLDRKFPKPSEVKTNRTPLGKFVGKQAPTPRPAAAGRTGEDERTSRPPPVSDKPLSVMDRIKLLKKPASGEGDGGDGKSGHPPKLTDGFSPLSGRRMKKDSSVTDLIKNYHSNSNGGSDGEARPTSPEQKPFLPPKPPGVSPIHSAKEKSPLLTRRPIGQQNAPPPSLPERTDRSSSSESSPARHVPHWKKTPSQEQHESGRHGAQKEEQPAWKRGAEEQPAWKRGAEEQPAWKRGAEEQPAWKRGPEVADSQPSWKKAAEEREQPKRWKKKEQEGSRAVPQFKPREENRPELPPPATPPPPEQGGKSPGPSRQSFTYKPYKASRAAAMSPPAISEPETPPPAEPPRPKITVRGFPSSPPVEEQQPVLPPRPPKLADLPVEAPTRQPPPITSHTAPDGPQLPQRPSPLRLRPLPTEPAVGQRMPPRPPKSQEPEPVPPPPRPHQSGSPVGQTWYHANLKDRKVAESRLLRHSKDGTFIIRDSSKKPGEYSLSLLYHDTVKHLRIRLRADNQYVLGEEKMDELPFSSVLELVNHHKKEPLVLKSGGEITLRYECPH